MEISNWVSETSLRIEADERRVVATLSWRIQRRPDMADPERDTERDDAARQTEREQGNAGEDTADPSSPDYGADRNS